VRLRYRSGDGQLGTTERPVVIPHLADEGIELDLGLVSITEMEGNHSWSGQVEVRGATIAGFQITDLLFMPATHWARVRGSQSVTAASTPLIAADNFDRVESSLIGTTADLGGTWTESGDTTDFEISETPGLAIQTAVSDSASYNGQYARLGTATPAYVDARVDISRSGLVALLSFSGIFLRYTDTDNWLLATYTSVGPDVRIDLRKRVGGSVSTLGGANVAPAESGSFRSLRVVADGAGNVVVLDGPKGGQSEFRIVVIADADLATGGALEDGGFGIYDENTSAVAGARLFNNFAVHSAPGGAAIFDHVINPNQSLRLTHAKAERENAAGDQWGRVPHFEGARLKIPPSTRNDLIHRLVVKQDRNDLTAFPVGDPSVVNLCTNPSAVTNTTGWTNASLVTFERDTSLPTLSGLPSGITTGFHYVGNQDADRAFDEIAVESGKTYRFSVYAYLDTSTATGVRLQITDAGGGSEGNSATVSALDAWTRIDMSVTADATETWQFRVRQVGAGGTDFYFTGVSIREVDQLSASLTVTPRVLLTAA
jgi:hypothetical protein